MLLAFSVTPLGVGDSVSAAVADAVRVVEASGLPHETNAMFTNIEGSWEEVMGVLHDCVDAVAAHTPRVNVVAKLDVRPGAHDQLTGKVESLRRRLDEPD